MQTDQQLHYLSHLIPSKKALFTMWIEHVPTSKKCMAPIFRSSSASFDSNDFLTLGSLIPKASNNLKSNPKSLTNSKKWSTWPSAVQWPKKKEPQYNVTILHNFFEKKLTYPSYCFFTWEFVVSSNLKEYGDYCTSAIISSLTIQHDQIEQHIWILYLLENISQQSASPGTCCRFGTSC